MTQPIGARWRLAALAALSSAFGLVAGIAMPASPALASPALQGGATVTISPPDGTVACGNNVTVDVRVNDVTGLYGIDFRISYDPAVVEVVDANPAAPGVQIQAGTFPDVSGGRGLIQVNSVDVGTGTISYAATLINPTPPEAGTSGIAAQITFRGVAAGSSDIEFTSVLLSDQPARPIQAVPVDGSLTVTCDGGPPPTNTPVPGQPTATTVPGQPSATPLPTQVGGLKCEHIVKRGETLTGIARLYGKTVQEIMAANGISRPDYIREGQILKIPNCTPGPVRTATPGGPPTGCKHVVKLGETLSSIGRLYGQTVAALMAANGIANPDYIRAGQVLNIPNCGGPSQPPPGGGYPGNCFNHVVVPGENLLRIALNNGDTIAGLVARNKIVNPDLIRAGQNLTVCRGGGSPGPGPGPTPGKCRLTHVVKPGETLTGIALLYGHTTYVLSVVNNLGNPNLIYAGQVLCIP